MGIGGEGEERRGKVGNRMVGNTLYGWERKGRGGDPKETGNEKEKEEKGLRRRQVRNGERIHVRQERRKGVISHLTTEEDGN